MNIPVIQSGPTIAPARLADRIRADRIRDRKGSGERGKKNSQDLDEKSNNKLDDGHSHVDEYA